MSQFFKSADEYSASQFREIDFDGAERLMVGGSTCDVYKTRWQRRDVFVKRLKEELRTKPLYLDALDKEFDIGARLSHPSIPAYHEFHGDYIVIDYVDGITLYDMIKSGDPWLTSEKNIVAMLRQLIDVIAYLHRHNVVHCDIKADNIMITHKCKNLMLVDFDKCYTDALPDTAGHPGLYGVAGGEAGSVAIDFNGVAGVLERLNREVKGFKFRRYHRFMRALYKRGVECDELEKLLNYDAGAPRVASKRVIQGALLGALIAVGAYVLLRSNDASVSLPENKMELPAQESDSVVVAEGVDLGKPVQANPEAEEKEKLPEKSNAVTQEELHAQAQQRAEQFDKRVKGEFEQLQTSLSHLMDLKKDANLGPAQLLEHLRAQSDKEDEVISEAFEVMKEMYPNMTDRESWRIMAHSKAYTSYKRRAAVVQKEVAEEYEKRLADEHAKR